MIKIYNDDCLNVMKEMEEELGGHNPYAGILPRLAQYELTADRSARTRGALLCYTSQGLLILREFHGSEKKLKKQQELLLHLKECGMNTDYFLQNTQESLVSKDKDQMAFTLQTRLSCVF